MPKIQLDIPEDKLIELKALMEEVGLASYGEVFNNALAIFAWAVRQKEQGRSIASLDEQMHSYKELLIPTLENVAAAPKASATGQEGKARAAERIVKELSVNRGS